MKRNTKLKFKLEWKELDGKQKEENQYILDISRPTLAYVSFYLFTVSIDRR